MADMAEAGTWFRRGHIAGNGHWLGGSSSNDSSSANPVVSYTLSVSVPSNAPVGTGAITVVAAIGTLKQTAGMTVTTQ